MKISGLATIFVASIALLSGLLVAGQAQADTDSPIGGTDSENTISGDSGSVDGPEFEAVEDKKRKPRLICKRERVSGSHMRRKVCRTQEEIDAQRESSQKFIRDINPAGGATPG